MAMDCKQHPSYSAAIRPYFLLFWTQEGAANPHVLLHDLLGENAESMWMSACPVGVGFFGGCFAALWIGSHHWPLSTVCIREQ